MVMKKQKKDKEYEERITMDIIVDANGPEGWYYNLEDRLHFPFMSMTSLI
jgi:hypothetical protein